MKRRSSGRRHRSSIRQLWQHSTNFRRLGWIAGVVCVLLLCSLFTEPITTSGHQLSSAPAAPISSHQTAAHIQPPSSQLPVTTALPAQPAQEPLNDLSRYPQDTSILGQRFKPSRQPPNSGFEAYYINTNQPNQWIHRENVFNVAVNYAWSDFHNIPSQDFGAYWIGRLNIPEDGLYRFAIDLSWSKARVLLDSHVILDSVNHSKKNHLYLLKGSYTLEVEYENNWHTTDFQLNVQPVQAVIPKENLSTSLAALRPPNDTVVYAVNIYESSDQNHIVHLQPPKEQRPYLLILSSYAPVQWQINGQPTPFAIIYNNSENGSSVRAAGRAPVLAWNESFPHDAGSLTPENNCHCLPSGQFMCSSQATTGSLPDMVRQYTGFPLVGISSAYSAGTLPIPQTIVDAAYVQKIQQAAQQLAAQRQACIQQNNRQIGQMPTP